MLVEVNIKNYKIYEDSFREETLKKGIEKFDIATLYPRYNLVLCSKEKRRNKECYLHDNFETSVGVHIPSKDKCIIEHYVGQLEKQGYKTSLEGAISINKLGEKKEVTIINLPMLYTKEKLDYIFNMGMTIKNDLKVVDLMITLGNKYWVVV